MTLADLNLPDYFYNREELTPLQQSIVKAMDSIIEGYSTGETKILNYHGMDVTGEWCDKYLYLKGESIRY